MTYFEKFKLFLSSELMVYIPKIVFALLALWIGMKLINMLGKFMSNRLEDSGMDISLSRFLSSALTILMKVMLLLSIGGMLGFNTTSFIAVISALMIGVGMALNGTIGHVASGVLLMVFKPFKVGDLVKIGSGHTGTVESINAFNTVLKTLDNKRIIISNSNVTNNDITNISGQETIGVELTYGIGYGSDIDKAREVILEVGKSCPHILDEPAQGVVVAELADSSVNLATRPFCKSEHYWDVYFYMNEHVKKSFDKAGIEIPFPQVVLHR